MGCQTSRERAKKELLAISSTISKEWEGCREKSRCDRLSDELTKVEKALVELNEVKDYQGAQDEESDEWDKTYCTYYGIAPLVQNGTWGPTGPRDDRISHPPWKKCLSWSG